MRGTRRKRRQADSKTPSGPPVSISENSAAGADTSAPPRKTTSPQPTEPLDRALQSIREQTGTNGLAKGLMFERLILGAMAARTAAGRSRWQDVWWWWDWPGLAKLDDQADNGIDIVALDKDGSRHCAVQTKFYDARRTLEAKDIQGFLAKASEGRKWAYRLIVSTTTGVTAPAKDLLDTPNTMLAGLDELREWSVDWDRIMDGLPESLPAGFWKKKKHGWLIEVFGEHPKLDTGKGVIQTVLKAGGQKRPEPLECAVVWSGGGEGGARKTWLKPRAGAQPTGSTEQALLSDSEIAAMTADEREAARLAFERVRLAGGADDRTHALCKTAEQRIESAHSG